MVAERLEIRVRGGMLPHVGAAFQSLCQEVERLVRIACKRLQTSPGVGSTPRLGLFCLPELLPGRAACSSSGLCFNGRRFVKPTPHLLSAPCKSGLTSTAAACRWKASSYRAPPASVSPVPDGCHAYAPPKQARVPRVRLRSPASERERVGAAAAHTREAWCDQKIRLRRIEPVRSGLTEAPGFPGAPRCPAGVPPGAATGPGLRPGRPEGGSGV